MAATCCSASQATRAPTRGVSHPGGRLPVMLLRPVVGDPGHRGSSRDVMQQRGDHELAVAVGSGERRALQGMLELIDGLAVVGQAHHRPTRGHDLLHRVPNRLLIIHRVTPTAMCRAW